MNDLEKLLHMVVNNATKITGGIVGFIFGILVVKYGWGALLIAIFTAIGVVGGAMHSGVDLREWLLKKLIKEKNN